MREGSGNGEKELDETAMVDHGILSNAFESDLGFEGFYERQSQLLLSYLLLALRSASVFSRIRVSFVSCSLHSKARPHSVVWLDAYFVYTR